MRSLQMLGSNAQLIQQSWPLNDLLPTLSLIIKVSENTSFYIVKLAELSSECFFR